MTPPLADVFADRSVFITGHTGFKGSWLAIWLHHLGARVTGYALAPPTEPNNFTLSGVRGLLRDHHEADIRDGARLEQALRAADPDFVFHLAAQALVRTSYEQPRETFEVNTIGVASLLDAVRACGKPCVVLVITSDKCYAHRPQTAGHQETDPLGGNDPYSASKGAAELVTAAYRRSFFHPDRFATHGVKLASARAGNVIGGGDWARDRIIADAVRSLSAGQPVPVRNPHAVRPWQHVAEPLGAYLTLAARMHESDDATWCEAWNFGPLPGNDVTVGQLIDQFIAAWGSGTWQDVSAPHQPPETGILRLAIDKARTKLGWQPRWDLATAIRRTADWYRRAYADPRPDMHAACLDDIAAYQTSK